MNHRLIRRVLMAAVLLFVPLLTTNLFAADINGALAYVPKDSVALVVANVDQVQKSPIFDQAKRLLFAEEPKAKKELAKLKAETGFDVFKDVHTLVLAFGPKMGQVDDDFVLIADAPVNEAKLIKFVLKNGGKIEKKTDAKGSYYLLGKKKDGRLAFRGKHIIMGGKSAFEAALQKQGAPMSLKTKFAPYRSRDVFAAALTNAELRKQLGREDKAFADLQAAAAGLNLSNGLSLDAMAEFLTAAPAQKLAKLANDGLGEVKKAREVQKMGLASMLSKLTVRAIGKRLTGKIALTRADVKKLTDLLNDML